VPSPLLSYARSFMFPVGISHFVSLRSLEYLLIIHVYKVINLQRLSKSLLIYKEFLSISDKSGSTVADERICTEVRNIIFIAENIFSVSQKQITVYREMTSTSKVAVLFRLP